MWFCFISSHFYGSFWYENTNWTERLLFCSTCSKWDTVNRNHRPDVYFWLCRNEPSCFLEPSLVTSAGEWVWSCRRHSADSSAWRGDRPNCPRRDLSLTHLPRTHFCSTLLILPLVAIRPAVPFPVIGLQAWSTPSLLIGGANGQNLFWQKVFILSSGHISPCFPFLRLTPFPLWPGVRASWYLSKAVSSYQQPS